MNYDINWISDSGIYNTPVKDGRVWSCSFIIHQGKLVLISCQLSINGEKIGSDGSTVTREIVSSFHNCWVRLCGCNAQYYVLSRQTNNNEFEIQFLYRHYGDSQNDDITKITIDKVMIASPIINQFYIDSANLSELKKAPSKGINYTFKLLKKNFTLDMPAVNVKKKINFDFALETESLESRFLVDGISSSIDVKVLLCFYCNNNENFSFEEIQHLTMIAHDFLSFICFEEVDALTGIELLTVGCNGLSECHRLYIPEAKSFPNRERPIINYSDLKLNGMKAVIQELLNGSIDTRLMFPIRKGMIYNVDILRYCAAIEYEVGQNSKYEKTAKKICKGIGYNNINAQLSKLKKSVKSEYLDDFNSAVMVFKKFDGRLASKLMFAHEQLLALYDEKIQKDSWLYVTNERVTTRIKNLRNGLAHGLREERYRSWQSRDTDFLQAMLYMLILSRLKVSKPVIRKVCIKAFGLLEHLMHKKSSDSDP